MQSRPFRVHSPSLPMMTTFAAEICFFPEFFALQLEGQNLGSKRGRLKSAKHYPYREQEEEHHKSKMQRFKKRRNTKQSKQQEAMHETEHPGV